MNKLYHSVRTQYKKGILLESQVNSDPLAQLRIWLTDAMQAEIPEPTAMALSTAGKDLRPSSRMVLLKDLDDKGITFFSNYESRKGNQLSDNPLASLLFFWPSLERQVRIEGSVTRVSPEESDIYFASRPEASRISASISPQSREIPNREWLEQKWSEALDNRQKSAASKHAAVGGGYGDARPAYWGGYRLIPDYFEFWRGREDRLHDRIIYRSIDPGWKISRLAP
jgi:pyridoxamine 5'-phosphate oxidase